MDCQPIRIQLGKILRENPVGNSCGKILWEILQEILAANLVGKSKKGSDWWKFSIWNRVMGSQPIRIQIRKILQENLAGKFLWENLVGNLAGNLEGKSCGKILQEILAGKSCGKFLWKIVAGKCCGKFLWENLAGKSCRKLLWEIVVGKSCGKFLQENLVGKYKKGSDWWKFSIWNRVMGSQPIRIQIGKILREILVGNSCGNILWEILDGNS